MRSLLICCCCLIFLALILLLFNNFNKKKQYYDDEGNQNRCIMTYMWRRMFFMETRLEHPRYSLFLYGEGYYAQKFSSTGTLNGIPILFVPGNAGSGRQVRSIGSLLQNKTERRRTHFHFDTFAVDFNEELTALDFEYIHSQSEFLLIAIDWIWSLYGKKPHEIVLIGHSMGGIVIQAAMMNQKFKKEKVSFILAFATPYSEPPFYFDKRFYNFWKNFHEINKNPFKKVISISGGLKDEFIEEIWTNSSAVTIHSFTSSIDKVWLDMDHKCILWCNQLVRQTSRLLFDYALDPEIFLGNFHKFAHQHYESIGIQLKPLNAHSTNDSNGNAKEMEFIKHFQGHLILLISAIESNIVPENELITFNKCGKIHQITRYLDKNHLFTFANVTNSAMECGAIIENKNDFWILKEEEVMKPQLRINLINQNILQFSMENVPLIIIPMDFIGDDFLIYRIRISRLDCKNRDFPYRIFFMENDRIRRANEIKGENENQQYSSILIYSNNAFANEYKIMLIDANKCKKILLEFSIDLRLSLIKALRLNRHILPFSIALIFVYVCLQLYKSKSLNSLCAIIIALLFHNIRQPLCLAFIFLIDAFFFMTTNLICILLVRPPLNKFVKTNDRQNSLYFPPLILKSLIFIFTFFAGNTSVAAIFFTLENIMFFNKLFENDLTFASMVALQVCSTLIQLPSIWTSLWNIAKYGEWSKRFDPFYESNLSMMFFIIFLNFIVPIKNLSNLYDKIVTHRKIYQFINSFLNLIFLILVVYIVYRNPMCIFIMDDLSFLINLFLIYKIIRQMQYKT